MSIYQVQIKKRVHNHHWLNTYVVVIDTPFSKNELEQIADRVAPQLISFERIFYSEEVEIICSETVPICDPPEPWTALRPAALNGNSWQGLSGLRPFAVEESAGPAITLLLGLQPLANHWGNKDYRYALHRDEIQVTPGGYQLRPESMKSFQERLSQAKLCVEELLHADPKKPALAISTTRQAHLLETYRYRRVRNISLKGIHLSKHRRR